MSIFRPDIKPPMWGPPAAISYAARANAERLGFSGISAVNPMYGGFAANLIQPTPAELVGAGTKEEANYFNFPGSADNVTNNRFFDTAPSVTGRKLSIGGVFRVHTWNSAYTASPIAAGIPSFHGGSSHYFGIQKTTGTTRIRAVGEANYNIYADIPAIDFGAWYSFAASVDVDDRYTLRFVLTNLTTGQVDILDGGLGNNSIPTFNPSGYCAAMQSSYPAHYDFNCDVAFIFAANDNLPLSVLYEQATTPYALLMPVSRPVYFDLGAGGGTTTLTTESAWAIRTALAADAAWSIRTELSQAAAWAVMTRRDADSAWNIRTSADSAVDWSIRAGLDLATAWPIVTAADTVTAWKILEGLQLDQPTAWAIRNALAAEAVWSIRTALAAESSWAILTSLDSESAWQILGAGILDLPTAWAIRADLEQATAWSLRTALEADSAWTIVNGLATDSAWSILQGQHTDTGWQIYRGLDAATAWGIISDIIPEPVRVFLAEGRDFIIHAEKRIFILLAERK